MNLLGSVLDYSTGNPIPGAAIKFDNSLSVPPEAPRIITAVSDATGGYTAFVPVDYYQTFVEGQWVGYLHLTSSPYWGISLPVEVLVSRGTASSLMRKHIDRSPAPQFLSEDPGRVRR